MSTREKVFHSYNIKKITLGDTKTKENCDQGRLPTNEYLGGFLHIFLVLQIQKFRHIFLHHDKFS